MALAWVVLAVGPSAAAARQDPPRADTASALQRSVEVAERAESTIATSTSSVSLLSTGQPAGIVDLHPSEALRLVPGLTTLDFDALGHDPALVSRGFFSGAGAPYVTLMLDGMPLNDVQTGEIVWDLIPTVAIAEIELVRGPAAALYGDAAVGGVINLVSADPATAGGYFDFRGGQPNSVQGAVRGAGELLGLDAHIYGSARYMEGYRDNEDRIVFNAGTSVELLSEDDERRLTLSTHGLWRDFNRPGPRPADEIDDDPESIEIFYSFDGTQEWVARAALDGATGLGASVLSGSISAEARRRDAIHTMQPQLDQGDTKERLTDTRRLIASVKLERSDLGLPWSDRLVVGADASTARLDSELKDVVSGGAVTYVFSDPTRPVVASGVGGRSTAAGYASYELVPTDALRISIGGRVDWLGDSFEPGAPRPDVEVTARHTAFSPKGGVNLRWIDSARQTGHLYASAARLFRAPTPDQLFDQRSVPIFGSVSAPISNPLLEPERGTSVEVGGYHEVAVVPGSWTADASLAVYRIEMEDEITFDPADFAYANVGQSRHSGVEVSMALRGPSTSRVFVNYTLQATTARAGANDGNDLPLIPRHLVTGGVSASPVDILSVGTHVTRHGASWLDDENSERLDGFTRIDLWGSVEALGVELTAGVVNLFDERYSTVGFLDPGGTDTVLLFPSAGRMLEFGFRAPT